MSPETRAFLARYDGIDVPDWETAADLSRMSVEAHARRANGWEPDVERRIAQSGPRGVDCYRGYDDHDRPYCVAHGESWPCSHMPDQG